MAQVHRCQFVALGEHIPHVGRLAAIEVLHAADGLDIGKIIEEVLERQRHSFLDGRSDLDRFEGAAPAALCHFPPFGERIEAVAFPCLFVDAVPDEQRVAVVTRLAVQRERCRFVVIADGKTGDTDLSVFTIALDTEDHRLCVARKNGDTALDLLATIGEDGVVGGGEVEGDKSQEIAILGLDGHHRFRLLIQAPCLASVDLAVVAHFVDRDGELIVIDGLDLLAVGVVFVHVFIVDAFGHGVCRTKRGTHHCCCHQGCKQSK